MPNELELVEELRRDIADLKELRNDIGEVRSHIQGMKAEREAAKAIADSERWTKWVALSIVFLAVAAAFASQRGGSYSGDGIKELYRAGIEQGKATNQWSYYQSVSIKLHMYEFEKRGESQPKAAGAPDLKLAALSAISGRAADVGVGKDDAAKYMASLEKKISKYSKQKDEIQKRAKGHDKKQEEHMNASHESQAHSTRIALALAILQVAIAVGSISALAKKKPLWFVSLGLGVIGIFQTING